MLITIKILAIINLIAFMFSMAYIKCEKISQVTLFIFFASTFLTSLLALTL